MRGRAYTLILLLLSANSLAHAACVDPALLANSTVSIARYFDDAERATQPDLVGIQGTAWFLSPTTIVTADHVAVAMNLSTQDWKLLQIRQGDGIHAIAARTQRVAGFDPEKLAVLELQSAVPGARSVAIRIAPLAPEDQVVTLAYPDHRPRVVGGRFVQYGDSGRLEGTALLEMYDGNDRLAIDHGASGAPVFDCEGRIAAVVTTVITQVFKWVTGPIRVSTAWGTPNVLSVPIRVLADLSPP